MPKAAKAPEKEDAPVYDVNSFNASPFVVVAAGEHEGRRGAWTQTLETDKDGNPDLVLVTTRDERAEALTIPFEDLAPAEGYFGGR